MADESDRYGHDKSAKNDKIDLVRQEYKRYKRKKPPPDFSEVVDFDSPASFRGRVEKFELSCLLDSKFGLRCAEEWRAYKLKPCPGLIFIANPFLPGAQHYWTKRCIRDFPRKPNVCNLDAHMELGNAESLWDMSRNQSEHQDLMDKLRWVHLGYHFDYNVVQYKPEKYYGFPEDLANLMQHIALAIGYPGYIPEAAIVNYYPMGGTMGGHTDHYELDLSWPLVSISFGQTAVFLIGGKTRDVRPTALYIRSGDILIMSGESRAAFHAVPRIIKVGHGDQPPNCLRWCNIFCCRSRDCKCSMDNTTTDKNTKPPQNVQNGTEFLNNSPMQHGSNKTDLVQCMDHLSLAEISKPTGLSKDEQGNETRMLDQASGCEVSFDLPKEQKLFSDCSQKVVCCECDLSAAQEEQENDFLVKNLGCLTQDEWQPFEHYLSKTRINVNVRQVHKPSETVGIFEGKF